MENMLQFGNPVDAMKVRLISRENLCVLDLKKNVPIADSSMTYIFTRFGSKMVQTNLQLASIEIAARLLNRNPENLGVASYHSGVGWSCSL